MNNWVNLFYYFLIGAALFLSIQGLWFTAIMPGIDRWSVLFFRCLFIDFILLSLSGFTETLLLSYLAQVAALEFITFLESMFLSAPLPMITAYLLHCCGESVHKNKLFQTVLILWIVYFILLASSPFFDSFYYITPDIQGYRGPLYPLLVMPMIAVMLLNLAGTIRRRKQLSRKTYLSFLVAILPITGVTFAQMFVEVYPLLDISVVLSVLIMYSLVLSDQVEQDLQHQREIARQQQEIANQRANIMVLQMRPHFIYNTMTSIYSLCNQDPGLARQVIRNFTTYLRKNFTAIASVAPIPFSSELEHTRAYLAVEQAQYEDSLFVEFDTPHIRFRVPPLTLQPIVENAIKHGRDPYAGAFRLTIRTEKTDTGSVIVVEDNGRGFEPAETTEPHFALENIRQRLEIMCGGSLVIRPGDEGGTVVTLTIPDAASEHKEEGLTICHTPLQSQKK